MSIRRWPWHWLAPALLGLGLYALTLRGVFVYDDLYSCKADERLTHPRQWIEFLREGYMVGGADNLWRPLVSFTYALQAWGNGDCPWAFHLLNILLHATACALVAILGTRLCNKRVGLIAGLLFAAHPVHVEAVAEIVGRAEELGLIGVLAGLVLFIGKPLTTRRVWGIVGWFLFAAFSKEQGLLLPFFLLAWYLLRRWRPPLEDHSDEQPRKTRRMLVAVLTLIMAAYIAYRNHILPWYWDRDFLDPANNPLIISTGADRWLIPVAVAGRYAMLLVAPYRMSIDYGMDVFTPKLNWIEPWFYLGLLAIAVGIGAFIIAWKCRNRAAIFCLIVFAAIFGMVSNFFFTIGTIMGDRLMYLPSAFFCLLIAMLLAKLPRRRAVAVLTVILILASIRTVTYAWEWNNRLRLYSYAVATEPRASMPYLLLAGELDYPHGDVVMSSARREVPEAVQVWSKSAWCKIGRGQLDEALKFALHASSIHHGDAEARGAMAKIQELRANAAVTHPTTSPR
jgi:hypothetical protein